MTPGKAIRKHCVECVGSVYQTEGCKGDELLDGTKCHFSKFRNGTGKPSVKIIRKFCLHCMGGSRRAVLECRVESCFLFPFRFGKNPNCVLSEAAGKSRAQTHSLGFGGKK